MYNSEYERFQRIRTLYNPCGSSTCSPSQCYKTTCRGTSQGGRAEPESAWSETEGESHQAFRFGPRGKVLVGRRLFFSHLASDFGPGEALANDLPNRNIKSVTVIHRNSIIKSERLLIYISEQVEWLDDGGSTDTSLEQRPEIFKAVRVNIVSHILNSVINHLMLIITCQSIV